MFDRGAAARGLLLTISVATAYQARARARAFLRKRALLLSAFTKKTGRVRGPGAGAGRQVRAARQAAAPLVPRGPAVRGGRRAAAGHAAGHVSGPARAVHLRVPGQRVPRQVEEHGQPRGARRGVDRADQLAPRRGGRRELRLLRKSEHGAAAAGRAGLQAVERARREGRDRVRRRAARRGRRLAGARAAPDEPRLAQRVRPAARAGRQLRDGVPAGAPLAGRARAMLRAARRARRGQPVGGGARRAGRAVRRGARAHAARGVCVFVRRAFSTQNRRASCAGCWRRRARRTLRRGSGRASAWRTGWCTRVC